MISSFDYYKRIESPDMYLCNPDQKFIGAINGQNRHMVLRFNDLSELTFTVPKNTNKESDYEMIATKRLIYVEKIGWFQIASVVENTEGNVISKSVTAESHQSIFKNKGFVTEERVYMFYNPNDPLDEKYDSSNIKAMPSVIGQLYQQLGIRVALSNVKTAPTEDRGEWTITYVDPSLKFRAASYNAMYEPLDGTENVCRSFEENTELFGYDFIINNVENAFKVVFNFDILYHTITIEPLIEITKPTDIYLSFDNVVNSMSITENSEDIVTVLSCNGSDLDIRTVNPMGTNYICNFDFYAKRVSDDGKIQYPWMSEELISALEDWEEEFNKWQTHDDARTGHTRSYSELTIKLQELYTEKLKSDDSITSANLQLQSLFSARDRYLAKDSKTKIEGADEDWLGSAPVVVETIDDVKGSLLSTSKYYNKVFGDVSGTICAYKTQPNVSKDADGKYVYSFDGIESKTANPNELIAGYLKDTKPEDADGLSDVYLYFSDYSSSSTKKLSFCKLNVKSEIGVAKDDDENIVIFTQKSGEAWTAKTGSIELHGNSFAISRTTPTGDLAVSCGSFSTTFTSYAYFVCNGMRFYINLGIDGVVSLHCFYVCGFDRYTTYVELVGDSGWCSLWENHINNNLVSANDSWEAQIAVIEGEMQYINEQCNVQTYIKNRGQSLYDELQSYWIEGSYTSDHLAVLETTTMAERIELAKELMDTAAHDLERSSQPQFQFSLSAINFIKLIQFKEFTNQLELGRTVVVEKNDDVHYAPALLSIEYDLDNSDTFSLTFSNAAKVDDTMMTYAELLQETSSVSRTVSANWLNLTEYSKNKENLKKLTEAPLDRTLRAAQKNMSAQSFIVDETGILGRKYDDDSHTSFLPEQIRIINNTILFTQDNWETAALALGKIQYGDGQEAYGLVADVLVGNLMLSSQMVITNGDDDNSILLNDTGILIKHEGENVFVADTSGNLEITGIIYATGGEIGGCSIVDGVLQISTANISGQLTADKIDARGLNVNDKFVINDSGYMTATGANISGHIDVESGTIGAFEITDGGLESDYIRLTSQEICFPIQSSFNLNNEVSIYTLNNGEENTSYITTVNTSNFIIQNLSGAGIKFYKDKVTATQTITLTIQGPDLTSAGDRGSALVLNYSVPSTSSGWGASYDFPYTATLSAPLTYPYSKTFYIQYVYRAGVSNKTKSVTVNFPAYTTTVTGTVNLDSWGESITRYNPNDSRFETGIYFSSFSRTNTISTTAASYSATNNTLYSLGNLSPDTHSQFSLGDNIDGGHYWAALYVVGTNTGSDLRLKENVEQLKESYETFFDALNPVRYELKSGTSRRKHIGFIAQEVEDSLRYANIDTKDFAGLCSPGKDETYYTLRYDEFIALNTWEIQKLKSRVSELEKQIKELKGE